MRNEMNRKNILNKKLRERNMSLGSNKLDRASQSLLVKSDELIKKNML
jgi:hypothetical protein